MFARSGHRGVIKESLSQNSIQAFQQAIAASDGFETDACVSKDGEVFLSHEAKYADAASGVQYSVAEHLDAASAAVLGNCRLEQLTADAIRGFHLKDGQPIPTLREALQLVGSQPGKLSNIELKAHNVAGPVLKLVESCLQDKGIAPLISLLTFLFQSLCLAIGEARAAASKNWCNFCRRRPTNSPNFSRGIPKIPLPIPR